MLRAILLDFGGTLDSNGLHWSTQFAQAFAAAQLNVSRPRLDQAFLAADQKMSESVDLTGRGLKEHVCCQVELMLKELELGKLQAAAVVDNFLKASQRHLSESARLLNKYQSHFRFALVSNFTSNLRQIISEAGLANFFDELIISCEVQVAKPAPRIYQLALERLGINNPAEAAMIGDSLRADISPAKQVGLVTVWINGDKQYGNGGVATDADFTVANLEQALAACAARP